MNTINPVERASAACGHHPATWLLALTLALGACSSAAAPEPTPNYAVHIAPILDSQCASCHFEGGPAPFRLDNFESVKQMTAVIGASITSRTMPPWGVDNSGECNTFQHARWLPDAQIELVTDWIAKGAPEGDPAKRAPFVRATQDLQNPTVTVTLPKYTPAAAQKVDDYRCFIASPGKAFDGFLTAFQVMPGSKRTVHHVIVYEAGSAAAAEAAKAKDASEDGPGYTCFGGPGVAPFKVLAGWAPGSPPTRLPEGVGLAVSGDSTLIVQVHYYLGGGTEEDETSIAFQVDSEAKVIAITQILADTDMMLAPGRKEASTSLDIGGTEFGVQDLTIHGVLPHMHKRGTRIRLELVDSSGEEACVTNTPSWDFNWQQFYFFDKPLHLRADQVLRLRCFYDTSGDKEPVAFGDNTSDEMCVVAIVASFGKQADAITLTLKAGADAALPAAAGPSPAPDFAMAAGGALRETARSIRPAADGGVYLSGMFQSPTIAVGETSLKLAGAWDGLVTALDKDGKVKWTWHLAGPGYDRTSYALETKDGRVLAIGEATGSVTLSNGATWTSQGQADILIAELDAKTGKLLNHRSFGGAKDDYIYLAALDSNEELWVGGSFEGTVDFGDGKPITATTRTQYLAKYTKSGALRFVHHSTGDLENFFWSGVVVAGDEFMLLAGLVGDQTIAGKALKFPAKGSDVALLRFDAQGNLLDTQSWGAAGRDWAGGVVEHPEGGVVVTFSFVGPGSILGTALPFVGGRDVALARLDAKNQLLWVKTIGSDGFAYVYPTTVAPNGHIFVSATVQGAFDFGGGPLRPSARSDLAFAEFTADGKHLWSRRIGTIDDEGNGHVHVDASNRLWLFGSAGVTASELNGGGSADWIVRRYPLSK